jgi:hypothetical protein
MSNGVPSETITNRLTNPISNAVLPGTIPTHAKLPAFRLIEFLDIPPVRRIVFFAINVSGPKLVSWRIVCPNQSRDAQF